MAKSQANKNKPKPNTTSDESRPSNEHGEPGTQNGNTPDNDKKKSIMEDLAKAKNSKNKLPKNNL